MGQFSVQRGTLLWWPQIRCRQGFGHVYNLAITHNAASKEPWYLLTNLPRADSAVIGYEQRFHCEELFKDIKDQLQLEPIRIDHRQRIERLLFELMIAYIALIFIGVAAQRADYRQYVCKDRVSAAWMALRLLRMPWLLKPRLLRRALLLYCWSLSFKSG